jgi:hypothetical protein
MASTEDDEKKGFLTGEEDEPDYKDGPRNDKGFSRSRLLKTHGVLFVLQIAFLALNVSLLIWTFSLASDDKNSDALKKVYSELEKNVNVPLPSLNIMVV